MEDYSGIPMPSLRRSALVAPPAPLLSKRAAHTTAFAAHLPPGKGPESPLAKFLIGGTVTIIFEMSGGHFCEMLKIAKQTTNDPYMTIIKRVTGTKGLAGTLDGFFPWGALQSVAKGSVFSLGQAACAKALHNNTSMDKQTKTVVSGGVGGAVQGLVMSPLLLLKTRVITDPTFRSSGGLVDTAVASAKVGGRIIATEGSAALFKGVGVFSAKRAADWSTRYLFVVMVEEAMRATPGAKLSDSQTIVASLAGGSLSALATIPVDVLVAQTQSAAKAGKKVGILETFREQGGFANVVAFSTRGLVARVAHVALTTMMMKVVTTAVYDVLYPEPTSKAAAK